MSDIQDHFQNIIRKQQKVTDNAPIRIYVNKIENEIKFEIKTRYFLELLMTEMMKLLGSTNSNITKYKYSDNGLPLEITGVVLVHCKFFSNDYQQNS